ncbi:hypothetical protein AcV5_009365 [Taiwanofungus camphoratus]|nr:hypothetical protein AcV5_009365 [Antrodia cinnamomea]KAI0924754.1 hypothetical protein AcW2_005542 [Antrodia cinnamomea]KAI0953885.1 hypothetical protein AcV7_007289 [Antrodia cinnamomea]
MRGYHIRISLDCSSPSVPTPSTSYSNTKPSTTFVPTSLFQPLPSHSPKSTASRDRVVGYGQNEGLFNYHHLDYRFGAIRIDWVDCAREMNASTSKKSGIGKERENAEERRSEPAIATFVPHASEVTKSGSTNLPEGVVHIYRDTLKPFDAFQASSSTISSPTALSTDTITAEYISNYTPNLDDVVLAVLAVPSWMTPSDFLAFVTPAAEGVALLRMIRDSAPNRSIVVMKFRDPSNAIDFAEAYNGKQFNSMEPEICHVVRVLSITIDSTDQFSQELCRVGYTQDTGATYELPTCPVCLERMDSAVTGLVTVPCSHTFHCACLSKWGDSRCPVCRYSQTLLSSHPSYCADCASTTNLWICLICGNIGCGRYGRAHAHAHYTKTTHLYALELETQRVWDYAGDGYVHRLIQNKADGKLVELPSAASSVGINSMRGEGGVGPSTADALSAEKIEAIGIEYSYLLTSQLDSQRTFYEDQTTELRGQIDSLRGLVEQLTLEVEKGKAIVREDEELHMRQERSRIAELEREMFKVENRAEKATKLARNLAKELQEERAVSTGLLRNLRKAKEDAERAQREKADSLVRVKELEDQVRDVMFFLEAKNSIENGNGVVAEAAGGSLELRMPKTISSEMKETDEQK